MFKIGEKKFQNSALTPYHYEAYGENHKSVFVKTVDKSHKLETFRYAKKLLRTPKTRNLKFPSLDVFDSADTDKNHRLLRFFYPVAVFLKRLAAVGLDRFYAVIFHMNTCPTSLGPEVQAGGRI